MLLHLLYVILSFQLWYLHFNFFYFNTLLIVFLYIYIYIYIYIFFNFWVSDCCLMPNEHFFLLYHGKNKLDPMKLWWCQLCTRPTHLIGSLFYSASSLKQQSVGRHSAPFWHSDSKPTSLCPFSLILHV